MLDKMFGVSPPSAGAAHEPKELKKDLRESSDSKAKLKSDFESALKKKMAKPKSEAKADKKEKKSSGEIKKKMTDVDDKMVLNGMASQESAVKTPDSKTEIPAEIEVDTQIAKKETIVPGLALEDMLFAEEATAKAVGPDEALKMPLMEELPQPQTAPSPQQSMQELESELGLAVDFKPSAEALKGSKDISDKLKAFDVEKNTSPEKAQSFEKNILAQLQKESFGSDQSPSDSKKDGDFGREQEPLKDMKNDLPSNQLHQAAGQSQGAFKAHVAAAMGQDQSLGSKLEENREANINEIMNQAQYLVKKGGGEMSVKMSPEGMGEVHLKVMLTDGKLAVEIQTQDKDVKKLVEDSLSELKSGLAAHRLSLEHVKVDTVNATNADNNTQFQSNLNQGGNEGRTQDFWKDVQSNLNQQSRRNSPQGEHSESSRVSQASVAKAPVGPLRTYGGTKGATVNRVA